MMSSCLRSSAKGSPTTSCKESDLLLLDVRGLVLEQVDVVEEVVEEVDDEVDNHRCDGDKLCKWWWKRRPVESRF